MERSMDLKQLEYFVTVVDHGGFSRASRLLGVAQPAISRRIRSLEVELGQNLFLRNGRGAVPTEAGKRLLGHARGILQQVQRARHEVDDLKAAPVGHIVIGLPPTLARVLTAPIVRHFRQRFPRASVSIAEGLSVTIQEWVEVGRVDVGVLYNPKPSAAIELSPLVQENLCLIGPHAHARETRTIALRDIARYPLILPTRPHAIRTLVEASLAAVGLRPSVTLEIDAIGAILELVAEGQGYAILSRRALQSGAAGRTLHAREIVRPPLRSALSLAVSAQRPATFLQNATLEGLRALAPQALAPDDGAAPEPDAARRIRSQR
jgi:LysR family nitrogen assimilation transcriptional regulator